MSMVIEKVYVLAVDASDAEIMMLSLYQLTSLPGVDHETVQKARDLAQQLQAELRE